LEFIFLMTWETYEDLYNNDKEGFELMKNSANALVLQFKEPIEYDLRIPKASDIRRLLYIFQDGFNGNIINPLEVDCCVPNYYTHPHSFELNFGDKFSKRIKKGLELCFNVESKYCSYPIDVHLNNNELFGNEGIYFRFREGIREKIEAQVKNYFSKDELSVFEQIGNFIQPYVHNLHNDHELPNY